MLYSLFINNKIVITNNEPKPCSLCGDNKHVMINNYLDIAFEETALSWCRLKIQKIFIEWLKTDSSMKAKKLHVNIVTALN